MQKLYTVVRDVDVWLVVHGEGQVIARAPSRELAQMTADRANSWAAVATTLDFEQPVPAAVLQACAQGRADEVR